MYSKATPKLCFVISPIGDEGSDVRALADDFLELLVQPALELFNFEIIRADKIARPSIITADIIQLVQKADICLIDLTKQNPNVFYECGRRHETGKPFIQLIKKGENLPFDVAGIRTIIYDLTDPRTTLNSIKEIQSYVKNIEESGYHEKSSGESLASISDALRRIERKVDAYKSNLEFEETKGHSKIDSNIFFKHPMTAFNQAKQNADFDSMRALLPRIEKLGTESLVNAAYDLALAGETAGRDTLMKIIDNYKDLSDEIIQLTITGLYKYFVNTDKEKEGIDYFIPLFDKIIADKKVSNKTGAFLFNQLQLLKWNLGLDDEAAVLAKKAVELDPEDYVYLYNLAFIYENQGNINGALQYVDDYMKLESLDEIRLKYAVKVYKQYGREDDAHKASLRLKNILEASDKS